MFWQISDWTFLQKKLLYKKSVEFDKKQAISVQNKQAQINIL